MKYKWTIAALAAAMLAFGCLFWSDNASAADLGGACCADLEERIAELEATTAKAGGKATVVVSGRVSQGLVWTDVGDYNDWSAGEMSTAPSYLGVSGTYTINKDLTATYVMQVGLGGYESNLLGGGYGHLEGDTHGLYLRNASVSLESKSLGSLTVGKAHQATDGITQLDRTNSWYASMPLSLRPITGPGIGEALEAFDGTRANIVRYDSPTIGGLWFSGSVAAANTDLMGDSEGQVWDVAARYWGTVGEFDIAAGIGYRQGVWLEDDSLVGAPFGIAISDEPTVISGSASVHHKPSGLFVNGTYGTLDVDLASITVDGYAVKVGLEKAWLSPAGFGKGTDMVASNNATTVFVEYGQWDMSEIGMGEVDYYGGGVVQAFGPVSVYASGRQYSLLDEDATVFMVGSTVNF